MNCLNNFKIKYLRLSQNSLINLIIKYQFNESIIDKIFYYQKINLNNYVDKFIYMIPLKKLQKYGLEILPRYKNKMYEVIFHISEFYNYELLKNIKEI